MKEWSEGTYYVLCKVCCWPVYPILQYSRSLAFPTFPIPLKLKWTRDASLLECYLMPLTQEEQVQDLKNTNKITYRALFRRWLAGERTLKAG